MVIKVKKKEKLSGRNKYRGEHEPWAWGKQRNRDVSSEIIEGNANKACPVSSIYISA